MSLIEKYNIPVPRYTSYPTVPFWNNTPTEEQWKKHVKKSFIKTNKKEGISLYIHLPFCESLCTYCACNTRITVNHAVESPYIETLIKEWHLYTSLFEEKPRIKEMHLGGGTPTFFSASNLNKLISTILNDSVTDKDTEFSFEAHPANTTKEHLETLNKLGFTRVSFGIQDFDFKVQDAINRYQTYEEVKNIVSLARVCGYESINFDLVYGLPFQTLKSTIETINQVIELKPDRIAFYSYAHVPWLKPGQRKFTEMDLPESQIKRALYEQGKKIFIENGYHEIGMDHFSLSSDKLYKASLNKTLHRNFMGYTFQHTSLLIGLGASSISDSWTAFSQNIKTVEEYREKVDKGHFPIVKGHILDKQDLLVRKQILNIMCQDSTVWNDDNASVFNPIVERLYPLEKDNLVTIKKNSVVVTNSGKAFLRNICLCFDLRFHEKEYVKNTFSTAV